MTDQQDTQSMQQPAMPPVQQQAPTPPIQPAQQAQQAQPQSLISFNTTAPDAPSIPASYQSIIDQQNEQIAALMAQNQALNGQITQMVQNGVQFTSTVFANGHTQQVAQPQYQHMQAQPMQQFPNYYEPANPMQQFNPPSLALDQDVSLESLAEQIGKKG